MDALWEDILARGEVALDELVRQNQIETVTLDFKRKSDGTIGAISRDDRRNLAEAVSAFANSMGGLLVWGVDARKNADGIDCAVGLLPISGLQRFHSDVQRAVAQDIMPRLDDIDIRPIPSAVGEDRGYLVLAVQRSPRRPHRSEVAGHKQYFKRAGDSSFAMEHYDIEDAFNRHSTPVLSLAYDFTKYGEDGPRGNQRLIFDLNIYVENISDVTAHRPYLNSKAQIITAGHAVGHFGYRWASGHGPRKVRDRLRFIGTAEDAIHPGQSWLAAIIGFNISRNLGCHNPNASFSERALFCGSTMPSTPISDVLQFGCENRAFPEQVLQLTDNDLIDRLEAFEIKKWLARSP